MAAWLGQGCFGVWAWGDQGVGLRYGAWCNAVDVAADDGQKHQCVNVLRRTLCRTVPLQTCMQHATWQHATCHVQLAHRIQRDSAHFATAPLLTSLALCRAAQRLASLGEQALQWSREEEERRSGEGEGRHPDGAVQAIAAVCLQVRVRRVQRCVDLSLRRFAQTLFRAPQQVRTRMIRASALA